MEVIGVNFELKKNGIDPGKLIRDERLRRGWSVQELANRAGIAAGSTILRIEKGGNWNKVTLQKIADAYNLPLDYFFKTAQSEVRPLPVLNAVTCGDLMERSDLEFPPGIASDYEEGRSDDPNAFYLRAEGQSMIGSGIQEGDFLLVEPNKDVTSGNIVLAKVGEETTVKKFFEEKDHIILQPMNPAYKPIILNKDSNNEIKIWRIRKFERELP